MGLNRPGLALCLVVAGLTGCARVQPVPAPAAIGEAVASHPGHGAAPAADSAIAPPGAAHETASDREIARLRERVRPGADAAAYVELGDALMQKSRESMDGRLYEEAESAYQEALARAPQNAAAMLGLAWVHNTEHDFDTGRSWAEKALASDPDLADAYGLLGDAAVELGAYDEAFAHYQKAMDLRPDLSSYSRAAHLLWVTGDALRARRLMQKAIDAGGPYAENTAWCRAELACMLFHGGALLLAERQAKAALRLTPDNYYALVAMGQIKAAREDYPAAIDRYQRAIAVTANPDALVALGDLYTLTGQRDAAERCYARVVTTLTAHASGHGQGGSRAHSHPHGGARLARFYADHERHLDDALREAEAAYGESPNVFVADTLAWCYYQNGRYDEARKIIREALKWKTPDANILFHAGMIYAQLGDRPAAQNYLYHALSLNPRFHVQHAEVAAQTLAALSARPEEGQPPKGVADRAAAADRVP